MNPQLAILCEMIAPMKWDSYSRASEPGVCIPEKKLEVATVPG